jgi:hypothetical protein
MMMKIMKFFSILCLLFWTMVSQAQDMGVYNDVVSVKVGHTANLPLPAITGLRKLVKKASVTVRSSFEGDYRFGAPGAGQDFQLQLQFTLRAYEGVGEVWSKTYSFVVDNQNPQGYVYKDLRNLILADGMATPSGMAIDRIGIYDVTVTDLLSGGSIQEAKNEATLHLHYDIHYGIDVASHGGEIVKAYPSPMYTYLWEGALSTDFVYPNYECQIVRLYNIDAEKLETPEYIKAVVDWTQATTFETGNSSNVILQGIASGMGHYAWRVRPIGTYYEGGSANSANWGEWSHWGIPGQGDTIVHDSNELPEQYFYYWYDFDKNTIYNRFFTENNKMKEQVTFANGLLQEKQSQVLFRDEYGSRYSLMTQTIYDYEGRPALRTLPVPVRPQRWSIGDFTFYYNNFIQTEDGELYAEKHFDSDTTLDKPMPINPYTGGFGSSIYYTGQNNVPSAEGYPYSRVLFYNDGSGRVKEQSGVGKTHMIGSREEGMGRTVRTLYSTPSDEELVLLFGSEAPNNQSVQKTITIDQNDVASIAYTGKDGKVIATALTFLDGADTGLLPLSDPESILVRDHIKGGIRADGAYVSSKRLAFGEPTAFAPEYMLECKKFELMCADIELDCGYDVILNIHYLDYPDSVLTLTADLGAAECEEVSACGTSGQYKVLGSSAWGVAMPLMLPAGSYMIEKKLRASREVTIDLQKQTEKIEQQVKPLKDWIVTSLEAVKCPEELSVFYNNLIQLSALFRNKTLSKQNIFTCQGCEGGISFPDTFWDLYTNLELQEFFNIQVWNADGLVLSTPYGKEPILAVVSTPCCENIEIDIRYTPPFKCPAPEQITRSNTDRNPDGTAGKLDVNYEYLTKPDKTEYFPDFEGYAISMLRECPGFMAGACEQLELDDEACETFKTEAAKRVLYGHMPGWTEGVFNTMVYHMLTDVYACEGGGDNEATDGELSSNIPIDACAVADTGRVPGTRYRCNDLATCWSNLVMVLTQSYCEDPSMMLDDMQGGSNISDGVDEQNEGDQSKHNDHFDDGLKESGMPGILKWFVKRKLSKKMRDMQDGDESLPEDERPKFTFHLAQMFLECTGYRFAGILEPAPENNCGSNGVNLSGPFRVATDFDGDTANGEYNSCPYKTAGWANIDVDLDKDFNPLLKSRKIKDIFPFIQNPVYAFKYFEYASETFPVLEGLTCYSDPNDCYDSNGNKIPCCGTNMASNPFCVKEENHPMSDQTENGVNFKWLVRDFCSMGKVICPYLKDDWTCTENGVFYESIKSYRELPVALEKDDEITCSWMTTPRNWYRTPVAYQDEIGLDYITSQQYETLTGRTPASDNQTPEALPGLKAVDGKTHYLEEQLKTTITYVEHQATMQKRKCLDGCNDRRGEFRHKVVKMFTDRCYTFTGCKRSAYDNIVSMEDVERITDEIVDQCKRQCPLTTYTCETADCRLISMPRRPVPGPALGHLGPNETDTRLEFGAGGHPDWITDCPAGIGEMTPCCANLSGTPSITVDGMHCDPAYTLSFYEQTNWLQAQSWDLRLDIESRCNSEGIYVDADDNGVMDSYPLYYYTVDYRGERILVPQNAGDLNCEPRPPGNTFVDRESYKLPSGRVIPESSVVSPAIGIEVSTP